MPPHRTVAAPFRREGAGVHSGAPCAAVVAPAAPGDGIVFRAGGVTIAASPATVVGAGGATVLGAGDTRVGMVEHLLAALRGSGITDALVDVEGPELPILDGGARVWCEDIAAVGVVDGPPAPVIEVRATVEVEAFGGVAWFVPFDGEIVAVDVDFGPPPLPRGKASVRLDVPGAFARDVAWARTFALARDVDRLRAMGRGKGATPENTVIWGDQGPLDPNAAPDEAVRHKLLDAVGDLALLGAPMRGRFEVVRGSHALHHLAVATLAASGAWRRV